MCTLGMQIFSGNLELAVMRVHNPILVHVPQ